MKCNKCGYVWKKVREKLPKYCAFCGTTGWNKEFQRKDKRTQYRRNDNKDVTGDLEL